MMNRWRPALLATVCCCGFPDPQVTTTDAAIDTTIQDSFAADTTIDGSSSDGSADVVAVVTGCKTNADCAKTCTGKTPMPCGCQAYLADSAPPNCDSSCQLTGCLNKTAVCTDGGACIIQ